MSSLYQFLLGSFSPSSESYTSAIKWLDSAVLRHSSRAGQEQESASTRAEGAQAPHRHQPVRFFFFFFVQPHLVHSDQLDPRSRSLCRESRVREAESRGGEHRGGLRTGYAVSLPQRVACWSSDLCLFAVYDMIGTGAELRESLRIAASVDQFLSFLYKRLLPTIYRQTLLLLLAIISFQVFGF